MVIEICSRFNTEEMCEKAIEKCAWRLEFVPDHLKTEEVCGKAAEKKTWLLELVQGIRNEVVQELSYVVEYVPNWFVLQEQLKILDDYKGFCNNHFYDGLNKWYNGYQKRRAKKAKIKEELLPIAWHPGHVMNWCMSDYKKRLWK